MDAERAPSFRGLNTPAKLTVTLADHLRREIESGQLSPGSKLPTEQEMTEVFGVSRTVVREAVSALRSEGLVMTRQGVGAFVTDGQRRSFRIDPERLHTLREVIRVLELRRSVEIEAAGLAAERRSAEQMAAIDAAYAEIEGAIGRGETGAEADFAFHRAIADATENPHFTDFLIFLGRIIIPRHNRSFGYAHERNPARYLSKLQGEHSAIVEAIRASDAGAARRAMRRHLGNSLDRYRRLANAAA